MTDIADIADIADLHRRMKAVMSKHPTLTPNGFSYHRSDNSKPEDLLTDDCLNQFHHCRQWLSLCELRKSFNLNHSSYSYKHMVEGWAKTYIYNGVLIAAAVSLGIEIKRIESSLNCFLPLKESSLNKINGGRAGTLRQGSDLRGS